MKKIQLKRLIESIVREEIKPKQVVYALCSRMGEFYELVLWNTRDIIWDDMGNDDGTEGGEHVTKGEFFYLEKLEL
jgi:hypothetical protein